MRWLVLVMLVACGSESKPAPNAEPAMTPVAPATPPVEPAAIDSGGKPPDEMDERMRHCPLALDGATSTVEDIAGGVRFVVKPPRASIEEARRRAHHIVDFAARKTRDGHGSFDGKGGGRMKNCPVVTDDVTITAVDTDTGAQLDVVTEAAGVDALRTETRTRVAKFPFAGATILEVTARR